MPNPQVHVAIGMIGALIIVFALYPFFKDFYKEKKIFLFLPIIILIGSFISVIPDIPELARDFPSVFEPLGITREDKAAVNTPIFNICFLHPYLDSIFPEQYNTRGFLLTLLALNFIPLFYYFYYMKGVYED